MDGQRFRFSHLSTGMQLLLVCILIGSCAGASDARNGSDGDGVTDVQVQMLEGEIADLTEEVRRLRSEVRDADR